MNTRIFFLTIATAALAFSCAKENEAGNNLDNALEAGMVRLTISAGTENTKTTLGEAVEGVRTISWVKDDPILVVWGAGENERSRAVASVSGETTEFSVIVPEGIQTLYAVYPENAFQSFSDGKISVSVPQSQGGTFAAANIALARTSVSEKTFSFQNVCGYLLTDITDPDVSSVTVSAEGQTLSGSVPVSFDDETGEVKLGEVSGGTSSVTASVGGVGQCAVAVLPGLAFADGVSIAFSDNGGEKIASMKLKRNYSLERSCVLNTGALDAATSVSYFVTPEGGTQARDGSSWEKAWSITEWMEWLETKNPEVSGVKLPSAPFNIYLSDETFTFPSAVSIPSKGRNLNIIAAGNNTTITCDESVSARLLSFNGSDKISISGVTFSGHTGAGTSQVILGFYKPSEGQQSVSLTSCTFSGNSNTGVGAALVVNNFGDNTITSCTFSGNQAGGGPAINIDGNTTTATLSGCTFDQNVCTTYTNKQDCGAIKIGNGSVIVDDCDFTGNSVTSTNGAAGAAVWIANCVKVEFKNDCYFYRNSAPRGGAVYVTGGSDISFDNCRFNENSAEYLGGAVQLGAFGSQESHPFFVAFKNGCSFTSNTAPTGGGAIMLQYGTDGTFSVDGCSFAGNTAISSGGGAIRLAQAAGATVTLKSSTFTSNTGTHGGAIANYQNTNLDIYGCTFDNNSSSNRGGAIYVAGENNCNNWLHIQDNNGVKSRFTSNSSYNGGGAIEISQNGNPQTESGSGVYLTCRTDVNISNTDFVTNSSTARGGAIDSKTSGTVNMTGNLFDRNYTTGATANGCGGALCLEYGNTFSGNGELSETTRGLVNISECRFEGNYTAIPSSGFDPRGGAVAIVASGGNLSTYLDVRIDKCNFLNNKARQAAAIRSYTGKTGDESLFINACNFEGNQTVGNNGLCLFVYNAKEFGMNNCSFRNNYGDQQPIASLNWVSIANTPTVLSNNTIVGQLQRSSGDTADYSTGGGLVRFEAAGSTYTLVNNIIASTKPAWCASVMNGDTKSRTVYTYSNKFSAHSVTTAGSDAFNGTDWLATTACFGDLAWTADSAQPYKSGWVWNGSLATGTPTTMNTLADVKAKIEAANAGFYTWLGTVDGLDKDQSGNARGENAWPGAYQK